MEDSNYFQGQVDVHPPSAGIAPMPLLPRRIGIIYCTSAVSAAGREVEKLADCEVVEVAYAVQAALSEYGCEAEMVNLDPGDIAGLRRFDWVFNLAETIYGFPMADFEVVRALEQYGIPFTGAGSATLRTCLDKISTKCELLRNGIGTPAFEVFYPGQEILNLLRYPLFVKPAREDGSVGINQDSIVHNDAELSCQVEKIHRMYQQAALVEQYIDGRDITVSVIGNGNQAVALPLSEIAYPELAGPKFLTFEAKWLSHSPDYQVSAARCPAHVPPRLTRQIQSIALHAYHALGCRDYARVDFRLRGRYPYVLEVNPNPCINPDDSGFVRASKAAGLTYTGMVLKILTSAVENAVMVR